MEEKGRIGAIERLEELMDGVRRERAVMERFGDGRVF